MDDLAYDDVGAAKGKVAKKPKMTAGAEGQCQKPEKQKKQKKGKTALEKEKARRNAKTVVGKQAKVKPEAAKAAPEKEESKTLHLAQALLAKILEDSKKARSDNDAAVRRRQGGQPIRT